jgi:hypothetical protein
MAKNNVYVYLIKKIPGSEDTELNDVGVILDINKNHFNVMFLRTRSTVQVDVSYVQKFDIHETGDRYEYKVCDRCFKRLETSTFFQNNRHKKDNIITKRPSCKNCRKLKDGKSIPSTEKLLWENRRPADFTDFTCPICEKTTIVGITKIVLDHNHETGGVRGWLCESCNTGIGRFDDNAEIVKRAVSWLEEN